MKTLNAKAFLSLGLATAMLATTAMAADDPKSKRAELRKMCDAALADLYKAKPAVKAAMARSAGYGCFTSFGMSFFVGGAGGSGLVHSNATKKDTYMKMGQASGGLDFGIKDYREVLVFKDKKTLDDFVDKGWEMGAQAAFTAKSDDKGGSKEDAEMASSPIQVYPMTKAGLAAGMAVAGKKYWKDDDLNAAK